MPALYYLSVAAVAATKYLAPQRGIEPRTNWLTANYSTAELLGNKILRKCYEGSYPTVVCIGCAAYTSRTHFLTRQCLLCGCSFPLDSYLLNL